MDNRKQMSFDQRFLSPLKNRPDIEPDESFVERLRAELNTEENRKQTSSRLKWRWPVMVPMAMAVLVFSLLTASFIGTNSNMEKSKSFDKADLADKDEPEGKQNENSERDLYKITASNPAYESIYRQITKVTGAPSAGRQLVYYFDALEKGDKEFLQKTLVFEYAQNTMDEMILYYHNADFSTIEVTEMIPAENNQLIVTFHYFDTEKKETIRRRLLIDMSDSKNFYVLDSVSLSKQRKDELVIEKVEQIEKSFKIGMKKEEAEQLYGGEYKEFVNSDAEDGSVLDWQYSFFAEDGAVRNTGYESIVDFQAIRDQEIGILLTIGWSPENEAMRMSMFYSINGKVHLKGIRPDGTAVEEEQRSGEIVIDQSPFKLSEKESAAYNWFKLDHDRVNLRGLTPLSIAKLYVQAGIDGDAETEYALYTSRPDYVRWTKEEHLMYAANSKVSKEEILAAFQGLQHGEFIETSDFEGYIKYENPNGMQGFHLIKDEDGIWKVGFMPIQ
jgi:hypothetical protein